MREKTSVFAATLTSTFVSHPLIQIIFFIIIIAIILTIRVIIIIIASNNNAFNPLSCLCSSTSPSSPSSDIQWVCSSSSASLSIMWHKTTEAYLILYTLTAMACGTYTSYGIWPAPQEPPNPNLLWGSHIWATASSWKPYLTTSHLIPLSLYHRCSIHKSHLCKKTDHDIDTDYLSLILVIIITPIRMISNVIKALVYFPPLSYRSQTPLLFPRSLHSLTLIIIISQIITNIVFPITSLIYA